MVPEALLNETALAHGAGIEETTSDPREAHARFGEERPVSSEEAFPLTDQRLGSTQRPGREADGFRDLRERNPRSRIPFCVS